MARQITIDDQEWIEIVNSDKEVTGGFWWNPTDFDIVKRCEKVVDFFYHMEVPEDKDGTESIFAASDMIKQQFDYLISPGASKSLFKRINPLSPREDGSLFAEYVLSQLVAFIESEFDIRISKTTSKIKQHTKGYK